MTNKGFTPSLGSSLEFLRAEENSSLLWMNLLGIVLIVAALGAGVWAAIADILPYWVVRILLYELAWVLLIQVAWIVFRGRVTRAWHPWIAGIRDSETSVKPQEFLRRTYSLLGAVASFGVAAITLSIILWVLGVTPAENLTLARLVQGDESDIRITPADQTILEENWWTDVKGVAVTGAVLVNDADSPTYVIQGGDRLRLHGFARTRESNSERFVQVAMLMGDNAGQRGWLPLADFGYQEHSSLDMFPYNLRDLSFDLRYLRAIPFYLLGLSFILVSHVLVAVASRWGFPQWERHRLHLMTIISFFAVLALQLSIDGYLLLSPFLLMIKLIIASAFALVFALWDPLNFRFAVNESPEILEEHDSDEEIRQESWHNPETLRMLGDYALDLRDRGLHLQAANVLEEVQKAREQVLGKEHLDTLNGRDNLAVVYTDLNRFEDAATLNEETLSTMERVLGPDHPATLKSRNNLAISYLNLGRHEDAIELLRQTLRDRERLLGVDHPETQNTRNNLERALNLYG